MIAVVDYGVGNLRSVERALLHAGAQPKVTADLDELAGANGVVLPGVGAFGPALRRLEQGNLGRWLVELARKGTPLLGVCLGYQLLFEESEEHGRHQGLGLLRGRVVQVKGSPRLPVIGWCRLRQLGWSDQRALAVSAVLRGSYHLYQGFGAFIGNAVMGVIFALLYLRWKRVTPLIISHALIDTGAFVGYALLHGHLSRLP